LHGKIVISLTSNGKSEDVSVEVTPDGNANTDQAGQQPSQQARQETAAQPGQQPGQQSGQQPGAQTAQQPSLQRQARERQPKQPVVGSVSTLLPNPDVAINFDSNGYMVLRSLDGATETRSHLPVVADTINILKCTPTFGWIASEKSDAVAAVRPVTGR